MKDMPAMSQPPAAEFRWTRARLAVVVAGLLLLQAALAVLSLVHENPTIDEVIHLPAGIAYWQTGQFAMYHHNPPLVRLLAALPAMASGVETEPLYRSSYFTSRPPNKAGFAHEFALLNARNYFEVFTRARLLMPLFAVLGGLAVFCWSRDLFGPGGGLLSLALWSFCPNVLAHTRLITTDVPAAAMAVGTTYLFWRFLRRPPWRLAVVVGAALGLAELTKFSLVLLFLLWPLFWLVRVIQQRDTAHLGRWLAQGAMIALASLFVINLGYGFEGCGTPLGRFVFYSRALTRDRVPPLPGPEYPVDPFRETLKLRVNRFKGTPLEAVPVPLPREYVLGFDDQKFEAEGVPLRAYNRSAPAGAVSGYPVYLDGELRDGSWWDYYLRALLYKLPEGTWALLLLSLAAGIASPRARCSRADEVAILGLPAVILVAMSGFTNIAIGLRYVLPILPFLYVSAGRLVPWAAGMPGSRRRIASTVIGVSFIATAAASLLVFPHYLAYFNWLSGGPRNGSRHLIDSNLDWGQDLVGLRRWLETHAPGERVGIAYFGQINPTIFNLRESPEPAAWLTPTSERQSRWPDLRPPLDWYLPPPLPGTMEDVPSRYALAIDPPAPGLYAVSASLVRGLRWRVYDSDRWAPYSASSNAFSYFARLEPTARIGHSIFVYRLTPEQAAGLRPLWEPPRGR
jgi:hypothetical protein